MCIRDSRHVVGLVLADLVYFQDHSLQVVTGYREEKVKSLNMIMICGENLDTEDTKSRELE